MVNLDELKDIYNALNLAQMEIRALYKNQNTIGSNVLDIIDAAFIKLHNELGLKKWTTTIKAVDPLTAELKNWCGPHITAISWRDAELFCQRNGLGYCQVDGELIAEIGCDTGTFNPNFDDMTDYETPTNN